MRNGARRVSSIKITVLLGAIVLPGAAVARGNDLTFDDRVSCQEAVERVYYSHQVGTTSPFEQVVPWSLLERKVRTHLQLRQTLENTGHTRVTAAMLDAEMERMGRDSKMPERLHELHAALGNDASRIRECLVRPVLVDRLTQSASEQAVAAEAGGTSQDPQSTLLDGFWLPTSTTGAPAPRIAHTAVWTGNLFLVWGGFNDAAPSAHVLRNGARYDPVTDSWSPISMNGAPSARDHHNAVWTGTYMIIWGGSNGTNLPGGAFGDGGRYDPISDTWLPVSTDGAPSPRLFDHNTAAVWAGNRMVVWGGFDNSGFLATGGRYDPVADTWSPTSMVGAPAARNYHSTVWSDSRVLVWGGWERSQYFADGGSYDPVADTWAPLSTINAPAGRRYHTAVWTGSVMVVWGGWDATGPGFGNGARYNPATDTWAPISTLGAPVGRYYHSAVLAGGDAIIWGGTTNELGGQPLRDGARYQPQSDGWSAIAQSGAPSARFAHSAAWTGNQMIVWAGLPFGLSGGRYLSCTGNEPDADADGFTICTGDCNDSDSAIHPGATETCDGEDNNCNGQADEGCGERPIARFGWSPLSAGAGTPITFMDQSIGSSLGWEWDFDGDGLLDSIQQSPSHVFAACGPYPVRLTVSNAYGESSRTQIVYVTCSLAAPTVRSVRRTYPGFFIAGAPFLNTFSVDVDWAGSPGKVGFSVNGRTPIDEPGSSSGASHPFSIDTDFPPRWAPSTVRLTPRNLEGTTGPAWDEQVFVFPHPAWLDRALSLAGGDLDFEADGAEIKASMDWQFPETPLEGKVTIPDWVPYISGEFGLLPTYGKISGEVSSAGTGSLRVGGSTGFEAMSQSLEGSVAGQGDFRLGPPMGLEVTGASLNVGLRGTISKSVGLIEAIPPLAGFANLPIVHWFNRQAELTGSISPSLDLATAFAQDDGGDLRFREGTGTLGFNLRAELEVHVVPKLVSANAYVSGGGSMTLGVPDPLLRSIDLNVTAGAGYEISGFFGFGGASGGIECKGACTWTPSAEWNCSPSCGATGGALRLPDVSLMTRDYRKHGLYSSMVRTLRSPSGSSQVPVSVEEMTLVSNVFPEAAPSLTPVASGRLLLWVHQNPGLPVPQSTDIAWSYDDGTGWSPTGYLSQDGRAEFAPVAARDGGGHVVAVWTRIADPDFTTPITQVSDLPIYYKKIEVVWAVFDPTTRGWTAITPLTQDTAFDSDVHIAADSSGQLLLTWLSNPEAEFLSTQASPSRLMYAVWNPASQSWTATGVAAAGLVGISSHVSGLSGGNGVVLMSRDPDLSVAGDEVIDRIGFNAGVWGPPTSFATGGGDNRLPSIVFGADGEGQVIWVRNGDLVAATLLDPTPVTIRSSSGSMGFYGSSLFTNAVGNVTLVWQETVDNGPANLFAMLYDSGAHRWSVDRRLTLEPDVQHGQFSGYYDALGVLHGVYMATSIGRTSEVVTIDGEDHTFTNLPVEGQTDLRLFDHSLVVDLAVVDGDLAVVPGAPRTGDPVAASLAVHNAGDFAVGDFTVELFVGEPSIGGVPVGSGVVTGPFVAGDVQTLTIDFTQPAAIGDIVAVVDRAQSVAEASETNNVARWPLTNHAPATAVHASVLTGGLPLTVIFDSSNTYDPDADPLSYRWTFGDGTDGAVGQTASHTFLSAGRFPVTLTATDTHGAVGTAVVIITAGTLPLDPGPVPDGHFTPGAPMRATANGGAIDIVWDVSSCGSAPTYNVYAGSMQDFTTITEAVCGIAPNGSATITLSGLNKWWVIVGSNGSVVGSFGKDSSGRERIFKAWGPLCGELTQSTAATCP